MYLSHLPVPGETVGNGRMQTNIGGKGANQAVACLRAGGEVNFISRVGDDSTGQTILRDLNRMGLNTDSILAVEDQTTGTACIFIDESGENCIGLTAGANGTLDSSALQPHKAMIESCGLLLMQLETPMDALCEAAQIAREKDIPVILNPAPAAELPDTLYPNLSLLTPNEGELQELTGIQTDSREGQIEAAQSLINKGVNQVLVTLGSDGALLVSDKGVEHFEAKRVDALDTTAAGDTFNGYLAAGLWSGKDLSSSIKTAIAASAITVTRAGAIPSIPHAAEIKAQ